MLQEKESRMVMMVTEEETKKKGMVNMTRKMMRKSMMTKAHLTSSMTMKLTSMERRKMMTR